MTFRQYLEDSPSYGYLADPCLEEYFWFIIALRHDYPSDISRLNLDDLFENYLIFKWTRLEEDRYRAWQSVRLNCQWFCQIDGGTGDGLS